MKIRNFAINNIYYHKCINRFIKIFDNTDQLYFNREMYKKFYNLLLILSNVNLFFENIENNIKLKKIPQFCKNLDYNNIYFQIEYYRYNFYNNIKYAFIIMFLILNNDIDSKNIFDNIYDSIQYDENLDKYFINKNLQYIIPEKFLNNIICSNIVDIKFIFIYCIKNDDIINKKEYQYNINISFNNIVAINDLIKYSKLILKYTNDVLINIINNIYKNKDSINIIKSYKHEIKQLKIFNITTNQIFLQYIKNHLCNHYNFLINNNIKNYNIYIITSPIV